MTDSIHRVTHKDPSCRARTGVLTLAHGTVQTPVFMPVGTNATVKALPNEYLEEIGFEIILANTYHLYLRPGVECISGFGGIHGFSRWKRNILTDSGGFQFFSLSKLNHSTPDGVQFNSHIDGSRHFVTPEDIVNAQLAYQSDIFMQLDICSPYKTAYAAAREALTLSTEWARRSKREWLKNRERSGGVLFPIVQGNFYRDLRHQSLRDIVELDLPGIAVGGLSVGEPYPVYRDFLQDVAEGLPENKPRYLMGIGTPEYIFDAVENGIDMFDCVLPTRVARNGLLFTKNGPLTIKKERYALDHEPIDPGCQCRVCREYSRAYLHHLFRTGEILYSTLASYHNLYFLNKLVRDMREAIAAGRFRDFRAEFFRSYNGEDKNEKA